MGAVINHAVELVWNDLCYRSAIHLSDKASGHHFYDKFKLADLVFFATESAFNDNTYENTYIDVGTFSIYFPLHSPSIKIYEENIH